VASGGVVTLGSAVGGGKVGVATTTVGGTVGAGAVAVGGGVAAEGPQAAITAHMVNRLITRMALVIAAPPCDDYTSRAGPAHTLASLSRGSSPPEMRRRMAGEGQERHERVSLTGQLTRATMVMVSEQAGQSRVPWWDGRKVRAPQSTMLGNTQAGRPDGTVQQKAGRPAAERPLDKSATVV